MDNKSKQLQETIDTLISNDSTVVLASPKTVEEMKKAGLPITKRFISYEEYLTKLISNKQKDAVTRLRQLPQIDNSIADGIISEIYEEIRSSYALGFFTSTIVNSILLLEYAMRLRLYIHRLKNDPKYDWKILEKMTMKKLISQMRKLNILIGDKEKILKDFNDTLRDKYLHINVHDLSEGIFISKIPGINVKTGQKIELKNIEITEHKFLWFIGKRFFDKKMVLPIVEFCVNNVNQFLANKQT